MDDALDGDRDYDHEVNMAVLILLLMDDALDEEKFRLFKRFSLSLNPSFNG